MAAGMITMIVAFIRGLALTFDNPSSLFASADKLTILLVMFGSALILPPTIFLMRRYP